MRISTMLRSVSAASLFSVFALAAPALAADGTWKKADAMPSNAVTACEARLKAEGYAIAQALAGRSIDRYVDLRYRVLKAGQDKFMVCRYDSGREKTQLKASKVAQQQ
jgi:hypothetical protein